MWSEPRFWSRPGVRAWGMYLRSFLIHGADVYPSLSSLSLLTSYLAQDYLCGLSRRGIPPPINVVPGWLHPGPQVPGVESRHRAGLSVVGPLYPCRLSRINKNTRREGVVISSIKYSTHPDIRSSLSLLIGWLTLVSIWVARSKRSSHHAMYLESKYSPKSVIISASMHIHN